MVQSYRKTNVRRAALLAALVVSPGTAPSWAYAEDDVMEREDPSVSTIARAPMAGFGSSRSVSDVDAEEIRTRQADSITEALEEEPGLFIQRTNRGAGSVIVRGLVGPENLIYFDGVRFNQSTFRTGPNQYTDTIDPWALREIRLVRGPGSVQFGSGAMGGVLHLVPRALPIEDTIDARASVDSGSDTVATSFEGGSAVDGFAARAGATLRSHGELRAGERGDEFSLGGLEGDRFLARPYEEAFWRAAAGYRWDDSTLRVNYYGGAIVDAMRVDRLGGGEVRTYDNLDHLLYTTYELDGPSLVDSLRVNLSFHRTEEDVLRWNCDTSDFRGALDREACVDREEELLVRRRTSRDVVNTFGSSTVGVSRLLDGLVSVTWGLDAYVDSVESGATDARAPDFETNDSSGNFADGSTFTTVGLFATGHVDAFRRALHLVRVEGGARVENHAANAPDVAAAIGDISYSYTGIVGSAGLSYLYGTALNAYATWNQGFRAPNLQEATVLGDTGNFYEVPNPELGPERNDTFEVGAKVDALDRLRVQAAAWMSLLSDRITREPTTFEGASEIDGKEIRHRVNRDRAYFYGADVAASYRLPREVTAYGQVSLIDGAVQAPEGDPDFTTGPLHDLFAGDRSWQNPRRLPPAQYLFGLRWDTTEHVVVETWVRGNAQAAKLAPDDRADARICQASPGVLFDDLGQSCEGTGAWATWNVRAGLRWETFALDLLARNLLDQRYRPHGSGVPGMGRSVSVQISIAY